MNNDDLESKYDMSPDLSEEEKQELLLYHKITNKESLSDEYVKLLTDKKATSNIFNIEIISELIAKNNARILELLGYERKRRK